MLAPSLLLVAIFVYGFIAFTVYLSFTDSRILPSFGWVGWQNYTNLFRIRAWDTAVSNLIIFGVLYIVDLLPSWPDAGDPAGPEDPRRRVHPHDLPLSHGVVVHRHRHRVEVVPRSRHRAREHVVQGWGWESFKFDWIKDSDMAIYTIVIAAVWQTSGFVMAMFLAGLRGIDNEIMKAAQIDGASTVALYRRIVIPQLRPAFLSAFVVLAHMAIKSYDLVIALTGGGPGTATEVPATFMYSYTFTRNQMGIGASSAVIMLMTIAAIIVPYLWSELREKK